MFSNGIEWIRSRAPAGFDFTQWHNYAFTYDVATGSRTVYMDGASVGGDSAMYAKGASWIDDEPFFICKFQPASHPKLAPCAAWTLCLRVRLGIVLARWQSASTPITQPSAPAPMLSASTLR